MVPSIAHLVTTSETLSIIRPHPPDPNTKHQPTSTDTCKTLLQHSSDTNPTNPPKQALVDMQNLNQLLLESPDVVDGLNALALPPASSTAHAKGKKHLRAGRSSRVCLWHVCVFTALALLLVD